MRQPKGHADSSSLFFFVLGSGSGLKIPKAFEKLLGISDRIPGLVHQLHRSEICLEFRGMALRCLLDLFPAPLLHDMRQSLGQRIGHVFFMHRPLLF